MTTGPVSPKSSALTRVVVQSVTAAGIVILSSCGVLCGLLYLLMPQERGKVGIAEAKIEQLTRAVEIYKLNNEDYPASLDMLAVTQPNGAPPLITADHLGRPMAIVRIGGRLPLDPENPDDDFLYHSPPLLRFVRPANITR